MALEDKEAWAHSLCCVCTPAPTDDAQTLCPSQVVQEGASPPQWPTNTSQLLGAPQGDVLGAGCRFVFSLGFKATLEKEIVPYRSPPLSSQPSGQRNICYFVTVPCRGCLGILSARMVELAVLPETLL